MLKPIYQHITNNNNKEFKYTFFKIFNLREKITEKIISDKQYKYGNELLLKYNKFDKLADYNFLKTMNKLEYN